MCRSLFIRHWRHTATSSFSNTPYILYLKPYQWVIIFLVISAVVTACSINANVSHGQAIPFKKIRTAHGINNTKSLEKSGIFTAEKAGLYLITVFIQTNTTRYSFNILKNNYTIADAFSSMPGYYQTTSTSIIERLEVNDIISLSPRHFHMYVFGGEESCLSILQV